MSALCLRFVSVAAAAAAAIVPAVPTTIIKNAKPKRAIAKRVIAIKAAKLLFATP